MQLDFSKLDQIGRTAPESGYKPPETSTPKNDPIKVKQDERAEYGQALREMAQAIKESELLRIEIMKGAQQGEPIEELFNKAIRCISLMTGDVCFQKEALKGITKHMAK